MREPIVASLLTVMISLLSSSVTSSDKVPCAISTWNFGEIALRAAIPKLIQGHSAITSVETGIKSVEENNDDQYFVGIGGLPNAAGVMEFDAAIMDHKSRYGAVMCLQDIKHPISVARTVMEKSPHNVIAGEGALKWALSNGFKQESVLTADSLAQYEDWKKSQVVDDIATSNDNTLESHDTVGVICMDCKGRIAVGASTSGWKFKHPGRVGDSPLIGSGLYCDGNVGAAMATGDGEEIMRTCLSFLVVELIRSGHSVQDACRIGIERLQNLVQNSPSSTAFDSDDDDDNQDTKTHKIAIDSGIGMVIKDDGTSPRSQHSSLLVGVIAMDRDGNMGAASTLGDPNNTHRGNPYFPAPCWRLAPNVNEAAKTSSFSSHTSNAESGVDGLSSTEASTIHDTTINIHYLQATTQGVSY